MSKPLLVEEGLVSSTSASWASALIVKLLHKLLLPLAAPPMALRVLLDFVATFVCAVSPQAAPNPKFVQ